MHMGQTEVDFSPFPSAVPRYDALVNKCLDQRQQPKQGVKCPALAAHAMHRINAQDPFHFSRGACWWLTRVRQC